MTNTNPETTLEPGLRKRKHRARQAAWGIVRDNPGTATSELVSPITLAWLERGIDYKTRPSLRGLSVKRILNDLHRRGDVRKEYRPGPNRDSPPVVHWHPIFREDRDDDEV